MSWVVNLKNAHDVELLLRSESLPSFLFPSTLLSGRKKRLEINSKEAKVLNFRGLSSKEFTCGQLVTH